MTLAMMPVTGANTVAEHRAESNLLLYREVVLLSVGWRQRRANNRFSVKAVYARGYKGRMSTVLGVSRAGISFFTTFLPLCSNWSINDYDSGAKCIREYWVDTTFQRLFVCDTSRSHAALIDNHISSKLHTPFLSLHNPKSWTILLKHKSYPPPPLINKTSTAMQVRLFNASALLLFVCSTVFAAPVPSTTGQVARVDSDLQARGFFHGGSPMMGAPNLGGEDNPFDGYVTSDRDQTYLRSKQSTK